MFASSHDDSVYCINEQTASRAAFDGTLIRLVSLTAIAAVLLVATMALRIWTAANDATLPPIEYGNNHQRTSETPARDEERNRLTFPLHPQI